MKIPIKIPPEIKNEQKWQMVNQVLFPIVRFHKEIGQLTIKDGIADDSLIRDIYHIMIIVTATVKEEIFKNES